MNTNIYFLSSSIPVDQKRKLHYNSSIVRNYRKDSKMNKYIVKATAQVAVLMVLGGAISAVISLALHYFKPTVEDIAIAMGLSGMAFVVYNLIQIRASALEFEDRLKEHKTK
jgi:hypothetical protein